MVKGNQDGKAEGLLKKGHELAHINPDSSVYYLSQAIDLFRLSGNYSGLIKASADKASVIRDLGLLDSAIAILQPVTRYLPQITNDSIRAVCRCAVLRVYGFIENEKGNFNSADSIYLLTREITRANNLKEQYLSATINAGMVQRKQGNLHQAFVYYNEAYQLADSVNNYYLTAGLLMWMANILADVQQYKEAVVYLNKLQQIEDSIHYTGYNIEKHLSYGYVYFLSGQPDTSLFHYRKAYQYSHVDKVPYLTAVSMTNMGEIFLQQGKLDSAYFQLSKSLEMFENIQNQAGVFYTNSLLCGYFFKKGNVSRASEHLNKAESLIENLTVPPLLSKSHCHRCYLLYKAIGNTEKALGYYEKYDQYKQQLLSYHVQWSVSRLERNLQLTEKEKTINKLEYQQQLNRLTIEKANAEAKKRNTIIIGLLIGLLLLGVAIYYVIQVNRRKRDLLYQKHLNSITRLKMQNIQNRISPHFFFNALSSAALPLKHHPEQKQQFDQLILLLRGSLLNAEKMAITLHDELNIVESYISVHSISKRPDFKFIKSLDNNDMADVSIPAMILQVPVENAIKHGLMPSEKEKLLQVTIKTDAEFVQITVSDNGIGRKNAGGNTAGTGTGLKLLLQTIHLLNKQNEKKIDFNINDIEYKDETGTEVNIRIPFNFNYELKYKKAIQQ